ncbi:MAG: hypothetical protein HPY50_22620 [Firmicutes bacterium]|nr:hypothetical protein [Bacillota bacterium]
MRHDEASKRYYTYKVKTFAPFSIELLLDDLMNHRTEYYPPEISLHPERIKWSEKAEALYNQLKSILPVEFHGLLLEYNDVQNAEQVITEGLTY